MLRQPIRPRISAFLGAHIAFAYTLVPIFLQMISVGYPLFIISLLETAVPLVRMLFMSRLLPLNELGFATVLAATGGFVEVATDIGITRFIYSAKKSEFEPALAAAHALTILRGAGACAIVLFVAPIVAASMSLSNEWISFALLAPAPLLRSFEHLSPRVAERDYRYGAQLKLAAIAHGSSLAALVAVAAATHSHVAILASIYAASIATVVASHRLADEPYRVEFRSPLFMRGVKFAYPLMINGIGLATSQWADRFIVAAFFGLRTVAVYSIAVLATSVPISLISRVLGTTYLAKFYHAGKAGDGLDHQVRLISLVVAIVAALYGGAVILLANPAIAIVFGSKFVIGNLAMLLLGLSAFVENCETGPIYRLDAE